MQQLTVPIPDFVKGEIYMIKCSISEKMYIGQTRTHGYKSHRNKWYPKGYMVRFDEHIQRSEDKSQGGLYSAMRMYGITNFTIELLHTCELDEVNDWETFHISWFDTYRNGYNLTEGGAYTPTGLLNVGVSSKSIKERSEEIRTNFLKDNSNNIDKIIIDDAYTDFHSVVVWIYTTNSNDPLRWDYSDYQNNMWDCLKRAYNSLKSFVIDDKISISLRLVHYLNGFEDSEYHKFLRLLPICRSDKIISIDKVISRYNKSKHIVLDKIVLKLYEGKGYYRIAACGKASNTNREIVFEFGGKSVNVNSAILRALKFSEMMINRDKISILPDLAAFIRINKINTPWLPTIVRKPRTVKNKEQ